MDKAANMGKTSATGSFQLFIGRIVSTIVLAVGTIIVGVYISDVQYGLYTIALVPATTFLLFQDWGVSFALTKYSANFRAEKKEGELRRIIVSGLTFEVMTGIALTLISFLTANFVASRIFSNPESAFLIALASIAILFTAIYGLSLSVFIGFEQMKLGTIVMVISAIVQGLVSPLLVFFGFGAFGAVIGYTMGSIASGMTALILLYFAIFRKLPPSSLKKPKIVQTLKPLLRYGIPLSIATIISGVTSQIYYFVMASSTDIAMIGNYKIATNFAVFLTFFIYPIQTVLFPAFSKIDPVKDRKLLNTVFASSVKYASLFLAPATVALMILAVPLISTIYGGKWASAPLFLTLSIAGNVFVVLGSLSLSQLLSGVGETNMLMRMKILTFCIGVPLAFLMIPAFGIIGLIVVSTLVAGLPSLIFGLYWMWKRYGTKADLRNSAKILLASVIAGATTYLFMNTFVAAAWLLLITGALLFLAIYVISIPLVGALNLMDINNLRTMFSGLGPLSKLLEIPLAIFEKPLIIKKRNSKLKKQE